jgi:hypothetical protein
VTVDDVVKTLNVDYTVSGAGVDAGGNVTMTGAPANATSVVRRRNMALVRSTDYQDQGELPATTLDNDIDATVLMVQQLDERLDRTFSLPASFSGGSTLPAPEPGYLIGWDATGENLTNIPASVGSSLVDLAAPSGSSLIGYLPQGTGAVATTAQAKMRQFVTAEDFSTLAVAIAAGYKRIRLTATSYAITSTVTIPANVTIEGNGSLGTEVVIGADVVGFVMSEYSRLKGIKLTKTGSHTKNGIEVGSAVLDGGRAVIEDVFVSGMGADGISVINGNLGTIRDVVSVSNGRDGINFTITTPDNNAWKFEGYVDLRGNTRDGLHLATGSSASDVNAPKSNSGNLIVAQTNGRYGVYVGTRSNSLVIYSEANVTADIYLDTYGIGNDITVVEASTITDVTGNNIISKDSMNADYIRGLINKLILSGVAGKGLRISNNDGATGYLDLQKTAANTFELRGGGSSGAFNFNFKNNAAPTNYMTLNIGGSVLPDADNTFNVGNGSFRWATIYAATGAINTSDGRFKQQIRTLSEAETAVARRVKGLLRAYKFNDAVSAKGDESRIHFGVIAQDVKAAFEAEGLEAEKYALLCYDQWDERPEVKDADGNVVQSYLPAGDRYGVRYEELMTFIISAL